MKQFVFFNSAGVPAYTASPETDDVYENGRQYGDFVCAEIPAELDPADVIRRAYLKSGVVMLAPESPSSYHRFDIESEAWLPNLDAARESKLQQVTTELNRRLYLPCNGFDADAVSRVRISGTIARLQSGDGLPAGWMGWRDAANEMHWTNDEPATVLANLTALSRAIEDREQALLVAGWTHKANIAALEDIDDILSYDVTKNWPT